MAARSGGGSGMVVTVVILSVLTLALFVTTIIFWSQRNRAQTELRAKDAETAEFVREDERRRDDVAQIREAARKSGKSAVGYLSDSLSTVMQRVTGTPRDSVESLQAKLAKVPGADTANLLAVIGERDQQITTLKRERDDAVAARDRALADLENETRRVATIETSSREALAAVTAELDRYKDEVERYREEITQLKGVMNQQVEQARDEARETTARLNVDITELQKQVALGNETAKRLQESLRGQTFKAGDEYALVDAQVIGLDTAENVAFINIGRNQKVVLGMTFEVYSEPTAIRPNAETGDYPPGKAALEVIRVDDDTAVARIVRAKRGNPVVRGDVIANAVYDPRKTYRMLVFGNFDANRDGKATPGEQADIEAMIRVWGGQVVQELSGNVDFLVLGDRPVLPPAPPATAPVPVIQEYVRQRGVVQQYDRLLEQARATSIPIINENRLRTLVGGR